MREIEKTLASRACRIGEVIAPLAQGIRLTEYFLAGNSLNAKAPSLAVDFDLYPANGEKFDFASTTSVEILTSTKNATTVKYNQYTIQFCNYWHGGLSALIQSFDFAHIQVGAHIVMSERFWTVKVEGVEWTRGWEIANTLGTTWFTGSEYPLSSLIRLMKYHKRGSIGRGESIAETFKILQAVIERGFADYDDFKDQLDAIDLGLVPEEMDQVEFDELINLFNLLRKDVS